MDRMITVASVLQNLAPQCTTTIIVGKAESHTTWHNTIDDNMTVPMIIMDPGKVNQTFVRPALEYGDDCALVAIGDGKSDLNGHIFRKDYDYFLTRSNTEQQYKEAKYLLRITPEATPKFYTFCAPCRNGSGMELLQEKPRFTDFFTNLAGQHLIISCPITVPSILEMGQENGEWKPIRGIMDYMFSHVAAKLNFTPKYIPAFGTGHRLANNTWTGTVGHLVYGRADVGHGIAVIESRHNVAQFSRGVYHVALTFSTGQAQPHHNSGAIYFPLSPLVWTYLLLTFLTMVVVLQGAVWLTSARFPSLLEIPGYLLKTALEQGSTFPDNKYSSVRFMVALWIILQILLATAYKSKLLSLLAFPLLAAPPATFDELAASSARIWLFWNGEAATEIISKSPNPTFQNIAKRMMFEKRADRCMENLIAPDGNLRACVCWSSTPEYVFRGYLSSRYPSGVIVTSKDSSFFVELSYVFKKESIFRANFDRYIGISIDMGLTDKWKWMDDHFLEIRQRRRWQAIAGKLATGSPEQAAEVDSSGALNLEGLVETFDILIAGCLFGLLVFVGEHLHHFCTTRKNKKKAQEKLGKKSKQSKETFKNDVDVQIVSVTTSEVEDRALPHRRYKIETVLEDVV